MQPRLPSLPSPPCAARIEHTITQLGRVRHDPYAWLKDENWQKVMHAPDALAPTIRAHLEAENAYSDAVLGPIADLRETIFQEMKGRLRDDDASVPMQDGPFAYFQKFLPGSQYPRFFRYPIDNQGERIGPDTLILDGEIEAQGHAFFDLAGIVISPDHRLAAWAFDNKGSEFYEIRIRDLASGRDFALPTPATAAPSLAQTQGDCVWAADSRNLFWVWRDEHSRPAKVFRHEIGGYTGDSDVCIYEELDPGFFLSLDKTASGRFIQIVSANQVSSEIFWIDAAHPRQSARLFHAREPDLLYAFEDWNDQFLIHTNADGAPDMKLMLAPVDQTDRRFWRDFVPARPGIAIEQVFVFQDYFVRLERENALKRLIIHHNATQKEHGILFEDAAFDLSGLGASNHDWPWFRFIYSSPRQPAQTFDYHMASGERILRKTQEIPSGFDAEAYVVERFETRAADGALIPVTILRHRDTRVDGSAPVLLYGYGSYSIPIDPRFSIRPFSLVDRGWIWAIAHIRGGGDKGRSWYLDGKLAKKMNSFTDFVAVGRDLVARDYARARRIVAYGGSAGGLLVGAAANLAPDLWGGIIAQVPFVDALSTMSDPSLPLTPPEWPEWGNPLEDETAYDQIAAFSPYDNVGAKPYPPILAVGGLTDPRVTYWEPAKWIAKLRHEAPDHGPFCLKIHMGAGHGGATGRFESLRDDAYDLAFAIFALQSRAAS